MPLRDDRIIEELDLPRLFILEKVLNKNNAWELLLNVMPSLYANQKVSLLIEADKFRPGLSEARILLQYLTSLCVKQSMLIEWLEKAGLEEGLAVFKDEEPIQIVEEPVPSLEIVEGYDLQLMCRAQSFPHPCYKWFRKRGEDVEELTTQRAPKLLIPFAKSQDSGVYMCQVYKVNYDENYSSICSSESSVTVMPSTSDKNANCNESTSLAENTFYNSMSGNSKPVFDWLDFKDNKTEQPYDDSIEITRQPVSAEILQGTTICLKCEAQSLYKLHYQWYCNHREIKGENSSELKLENVFPNDSIGEMKSEYQCLVYNDFCRVLSHSASIILKPVDESVQHFAEEKIALLIANDTYRNWNKLTLPANDVAVIAKDLKSIGFKVLAFRNLNYKQMMNAVHIFCGTLRPNSYGLYYFAGHGFEHCKQTYALPVDSGSEPDCKECLCTEYVLMRMKMKNTALNVMLFDACRMDLPSNKNNTKDPYYPVNVRHTVFFYSTSFLNYSHENSTEENGYFVKYLKRYLANENCLEMNIVDIIRKVQEDLKADPELRSCQEPNLHCGSTEYRSLRDAITPTGSSVFDQSFSWITGEVPVFNKECIQIIGVDSTIILTFHLHKETFCNAIDIHLCLVVYNDKYLPIIKQMKLTICILMNGIEIILPCVSEVTKYDGHIFMQNVYQLLDLQNITEKLECELRIDQEAAIKFSLFNNDLLEFNKLLSFPLPT